MNAAIVVLLAVVLAACAILLRLAYDRRVSRSEFAHDDARAAIREAMEGTL